MTNIESNDFHAINQQNEEMISEIHCLRGENKENPKAREEFGVERHDRSSQE